MILWPLFRKIPVGLLAFLGGILVLIGLNLASIGPVRFPWLIPLGIVPEGFISSDYFPLLPHLGFFLLGAVLGKTLYAKKQSLLLDVNARNPIIRFFRFCGKHSLWIYLLHQPVLNSICWALSAIL
jgi:uncharacterized membrane protein